MRKINKIFLELYDDRKQLLALGVFTYLVHLMSDTIPSDTGVTYAAGIVSSIIGLAGVSVSIWQTIAANNRANDALEEGQRNTDMTAQIATDNLAFQKEQQRKLEKQKEVYRNMEFTNPYAEVKNPFANLENVYEDLTVNQQQAQFQEQQGAQQRADIMRELRGAAGGSGISALAQSLARQGALQTQQISAQIGQQEAANQRAAAQGAADIQKMEAEGAFTAQMTRLSGEQMLQQAEMDRQATLLGMQMGQTAGAQAAYQQSLSNQMAATAATANLFGQQAAALYGQAGQTLANTASITGDVLEYKASIDS
jgi:hypothetical protein